MEVLLLSIYSFFVWLIFIKFRWLPWNITTQVIVVIIPIVGLTTLILSLNVFAPSSIDVRVYKYTVPIVSQVRGRVLEVGVEEGNRLVKRGDLLFRIDPTPYQLEVNTLKAQLANAQAGQRETEESLKGARGKVAESKAAVDQAASQLRAATAAYDLARKRAQQYRELVRTGAGSKFDLEKAETELRTQESNVQSARSLQAQARSGQVQSQASEQQIVQRLGANVDGEYAQVAQIRAQLEAAQWNLDQTTTRSPCDCYVVNLQLRPGGFVAGLPVNPVMTLVEATGHVVALYQQNELHQVESGNEAEFTLKTTPGRIIKATVDSVIWAQAQGQLMPSGALPESGYASLPPGRFAVKFNIDKEDQDLFMAAGAAGDAAIYTNHGHHIHLVRKVIIRVMSYLNYLVLKLH